VICPICHEPWVVGDVRVNLPCGHRFHHECIEEWLTSGGDRCAYRCEPPIRRYIGIR
jgi:hypothetical protein